MIYVYYYDAIIGKIGIRQEEEFITGVCLPGKAHFQYSYADKHVVETDTALIREAYKQLEEYLNLKRKAFDLPLKLIGTDFQIKVYSEINKIPYGSVATYKDIASKTGNCSAARAVGQACGRNPIPVFVPCHRVIASSGEINGYCAGTEIKRKLLQIEQCRKGMPIKQT